MLTCRRCKADYGEFRERCPVCGLERPRKFKRVRVAEARHYCEDCGRGIRAESNRFECEVCGATECKRCVRKHQDECLRREMEMEMADLDDLVHGRGIYGEGGKS